VLMRCVLAAHFGEGVHPHKKMKSKQRRRQIRSRLPLKRPFRTRWTSIIDGIPRSGGVIEFIETALTHMDNYGVHRDLEVYKSLIDIMPKGRYVPDNLIQAAFHHYAKHQDCIVKVLDQMERNSVIPDEEVGEMITNIFSIYSSPMKKYSRMAYWMPKFKNASPWPLPFDLPRDNVELAKLAIERITSVDRFTKISVYEAEEIPEDVQVQQRLLSHLPKDKALFVEGGFRVWLHKTMVTYFILRGEPSQRILPQGDPDDVESDFKLWMHGERDSTSLTRPLSVHEQEDGTILAVCATGTSSKDSLLSWIRFLQRENPEIENIPILFTLTSPLGPVIPLDSEAKGIKT
ncbi:Evolutionarily conserved signaling intermediate in Toll pathway_ mitochondrial, partial [Caligus rogercresseyi]